VYVCVCVCVCACSVELAWFASLKLCQQTQVNCICRASSEIPFPHASGKAELCIILCGDKVLSGEQLVSACGLRDKGKRVNICTLPTSYLQTCSSIPAHSFSHSVGAIVNLLLHCICPTSTSLHMSNKLSALNMFVRGGTMLSHPCVGLARTVCIHRI
jgi:hypothetical protein